MINIEKSQPAPDCLEVEKKKKNGTYRCEDTYKRIASDFFGKCYLCEYDKPSGINIEHFKPHYQGKNKDRKFDWNNLFFSCSHCNGIKTSSEIELLNCINPDHKIIDWIKFDIKPFPKELPKITAINKIPIVENTVELLDKIYNYKINDDTFSSTKDAANNLRHKLLLEIEKFGKLLKEYYEDEIDSSSYEKKILKRKIKKLMSTKSPFSAFKIWIIKENITFKKDFMT